MDYLVTGSVIVNNLKFLDGSLVNNILGGCAIYSYSGVRMVTDSCEVSAKVGEDFDSFYGDYFRKNGISADYMTSVDPHTMNTILEYHEDGSYWDHSIWGSPTVYHTDAFHYHTDYFEPYFKDVKKAVYFYNDVEPVAEAKKKYGFKIMMEGKCCATADYKDTFLRSVPITDIYSINMNECCDIFGLETEEQCIKKILELEKPCFFRLGTKGSMMIENGKTTFVPICRIATGDPDPTGCGNCSTATAMWAYFEGYDPLMTCCISNVTAGYNAMQYGPVQEYTEEQRKDIFRRAEALYKEMK